MTGLKEKSVKIIINYCEELYNEISKLNIFHKFCLIFILVLIIILFPVFYLGIHILCGLGFGLKEKLDYDWLAYYGSIVTSLFTFLGIWITLKIEGDKSRKIQINEVRPIFNISTDFERMSLSCNDVVPEIRILEEVVDKNDKLMTKTDSGDNKKLKFTNLIDLKKTDLSNSDLKCESILIKVNNIGMGHALLEKVICKDSYDRIISKHILKSDEKFMIDKGTSNILLIRFDGELKGEEIVEFTLRDILDNKYLYKMKLVPTVEKIEDQGNKHVKKKLTFKKIKVHRNLNGEEEMFILVKLDNAYFEEYFPELL